jgi:hypothetical protein
MEITCTNEEKLAISAVLYQRDVINRMITLINELEARIIQLEAQ